MKKYLILVVLALASAVACNDDSEGNKEPAAIVVKSVKITQYPSLDPNGNNWDLSSIYPDMVVEFYKGGTKIYTSGVAKNVTAPPINFLTNAYLDMPNDTYEIRLSDDDTDVLGGYERMATFFFKPYSGKMYTVGSIKDGAFQAEVTVEFQY